MVVEVKSALEAITEKAFEKKLDRWSLVARATLSWFYNQEDNERILDAINKIKNEKDVHAASSAFGYRFKFPKEFIDMMYAKGEHFKSLYAIEIAKMTLGASIIEALGELGYLKYELKDSHHKTVTGTVMTSLVPWYSFQEHKKEMFNKETGLPSGVSTMPGGLAQNKINVHPWESPKKYTSAMKQNRRNQSSIPLQVIYRTTEEWEAVFKSQQWYISGVEDSKLPGKEPLGLLNERVDELVQGMLKVQEYDRLYIQWGFQPSTRDLCMCTIEGLAPHGKYKYSWQFANERIINQDDIDAAIRVSSKMYSKSKHRTKINTDDAITLWNNESNKVLQWLLSGYKDLNEKVYFKGLHQILTDGIGGKTKRMIFEDLASNGPGIFGTNFRLSAFARLSNLTSSKTVHDGHQEIANVCEIEDTPKEDARDIVKQLVSNAFTHGAGTKGISLKLGLDLAQLNEGLKNVYGEEFVYMNAIARHVGRMINNTNMSTPIITPDGFIGINQAYAEQNKFQLPYLSLRTGKVRSVSMIRDMPILFKGNSNVPENMLFADKGGIKNMGGFANPSHGLDAYMKRRIDALLAKLGLAALDIHDNFGSTGTGLKTSRKAVKTTHIKFWKHNYFMGMIRKMEAKTPIDVGRLELKTGDLAVSEIYMATEFLQP